MTTSPKLHVLLVQPEIPLPLLQCLLVVLDTATQTACDHKWKLGVQAISRGVFPPHLSRPHYRPLVSSHCTLGPVFGIHHHVIHLCALNTSRNSCPLLFIFRFKFSLFEENLKFLEMGRLLRKRRLLSPSAPGNGEPQKQNKTKQSLVSLELRLGERGSPQAENQMVFSAGQGEEVAGWGGDRSLAVQGGGFRGISGPCLPAAGTGARRPEVGTSTRCLRRAGDRCSCGSGEAGWRGHGPGSWPPE